MFLAGIPHHISIIIVVLHTCIEIYYISSLHTYFEIHYIIYLHTYFEIYYIISLHTYFEIYYIISLHTYFEIYYISSLHTYKYIFEFQIAGLTFLQAVLFSFLIFLRAAHVLRFSKNFLFFSSSSLCVYILHFVRLLSRQYFLIYFFKKELQWMPLKVM